MSFGESLTAFNKELDAIKKAGEVVRKLTEKAEAIAEAAAQLKTARLNLESDLDNLTAALDLLADEVTPPEAVETTADAQEIKTWGNVKDQGESGELDTPEPVQEFKKVDIDHEPPRVATLNSNILNNHL